MFSSPLPVERMIQLTKAGGGGCGVDLSWDDTEWTPHSEAKKVEVNRTLDGPCWRESKFTIFTMEANHWQRDCTNLILFHDVMIAKMKMRCVNMKTVLEKNTWGNLTRRLIIWTRSSLCHYGNSCSESL